MAKIIIIDPEPRVQSQIASLLKETGVHTLRAFANFEAFEGAYFDASRKAQSTKSLFDRIFFKTGNTW